MFRNYYNQFGGYSIEASISGDFSNSRSSIGISSNSSFYVNDEGSRHHLTIKMGKKKKRKGT
jgi:hypothetical protein